MSEKNALAFDFKVCLFDVGACVCSEEGFRGFSVDVDDVEHVDATEVVEVVE